MTTPYGQYAGGSAFEAKTLGMGDSGGFDFDAMLGPISSGLNLVGGLFKAASLFSQSSGLTKDYREMRRRAAQRLEQGFETARDIQHEGAGVVGQMTAQFGKSGTLLEGSPLLVLADTQSEIERGMSRTIEQARIDYEAMMYQAKKLKREAKEAKRSGIAGIVGSVAGIVAAPFTGGASLALTAAGGFS